MHKPLIIGVDIRYLRIAKTGTRTYLEELCKEFKKLPNDDIKFHFFDSGLPIYTGNNRLLKWVEHFRYQGWKQFTFDIVFCADDCVPLIHLGYQTIPVIHDAFFFELPQNYSKLWLWLHLNTIVPAAKKSAFVITPTEWSKKQLNHYTGIPNNKLIVVPEGPKTFSKPGTDYYHILKKHHLNTGNYILHTGYMSKRKNIPALIEAFGKLKNDGYPQLKLVLGGPSPFNKTENNFQLVLDAIKTHSLENDVVITGYLSDEELAGLYQNALIYVFPSINEGFGLPVLEAFSYDLPVLVANNTCLPEVGGDAVITFDPFDIEDMAKKIKMVLDNEQLRIDMVVKGRERLKLFSWQQTAIQLISIFKKAT
jgi:glycosyltransferase involved in cell wall biosynthesis